MPTFNEKVRIFGDELEESDTFIDAQVSGYSLDGDVRLVEDTDITPREWTVPETNIKDWRRKDLLLGHEQLPNPNHPVWETIGKLQDHTADTALGAAQSEIERMTRKLFKESAKAQRSQNSNAN